jgi:hypothetical protein
MRDGGETSTWDGNRWNTATCMGATPCDDATCTLAGKYVAKMCARVAGRRSDGSSFCDSNSAAPMTCVDVDFEYPAAALVQGILP